MLALPLRDVDLSVKLPPGLQLAATSAGHLDCRMQLLGVQLDWPATGRYKTLPQRHASFGLCRCCRCLMYGALPEDHFAVVNELRSIANMHQHYCRTC